MFELNGHFYAPNICYETVIPHVIRRQAATLVGRQHRPADVLINLTNDAWYWGSSELDMHLACGVFRAVETRTPLVIAANGGISAWIDQLRPRPRPKPASKKPDIIHRRRRASCHDESVTCEFGDWFAVLCLACCVRVCRCRLAITAASVESACRRATLTSR